MLKEICEQPAVIGDTLHAFLNPLQRRSNCPRCRSISRPCRAHHRRLRHRRLAGMVGEILVRAAGAPAGGIRHRQRVPLPRPRPCRRAASPSSSRSPAKRSTAWRHCATPGARAKRSCRSSTCPRARSRANPSRAADPAGPEIGVASTKAFTTQLTVLACLAIAAARARGAIDDEREAALAAALTEVPARAAEVLQPRCPHPGDRPRGRRRRATCSSSAVAPPIRSRSKAR